SDLFVRLNLTKEKVCASLVNKLDVRLVKLPLKNNRLWHLIRIPEDLESSRVSEERFLVQIPDLVCQFSKAILAFTLSLSMTLKVRLWHRLLPKNWEQKLTLTYQFPKK